MVEVMKIMAASFKVPMHTLLHSVPPTLKQATTDPCLHRRLKHKGLAQSLWGLWVLVQTRFCFSPPSISGRYRL